MNESSGQETSEIKEQNRLLDEEEPLVSDEEGTDAFEDEEQPAPFSMRRKITIGLTVLLSFVIFAILFFPYESVVRFALQKFARTVRVDFNRADLNLFGPDRIEDLKVMTPDGSFINAKTIIADIEYFSLFSGAAIGEITAKKLDAEVAGFSFKTKSLQIKVNLKNTFETLKKWEGRLQLISKNIDTGSLPQGALKMLPIPISLDGLKIKAINIGGMMARGGKIHLQKSIIKSNWADADIEGNIVLRGASARPVMDLNICIRPDANLKNNNSTMFELIKTFGSTIAGKLCFKVKGGLNNLKFEPVKDQKQEKL